MASLSHIGSEWEHVSKALQDSAICTNIVKLKADPARDQHLSSYYMSSIIGQKFQVSSFGSDHKHYLLWQDSQEEAVLTVQGILVNAYIPPVIGCNTHYANMEDTTIISCFGDLSAIRGENCLVIPSHLCKDPSLEPGLVVDGEGGTHSYTEDNIVHFNEWHFTNKNIVNQISTVHPGTLRAGDVVELGLSFQIIHFQGKGRFQLHLDSVSIVERKGGDILEKISRMKDTESKKDIKSLPKMNMDGFHGVRQVRIKMKSHGVRIHGLVEEIEIRLEGQVESRVRGTEARISMDMAGIIGVEYSVDSDITPTRYR
ncbi:hypothetical protein EDD18DRAFT_1107753 [Armillaria luteobubalina]|uniref:Uncharacterized protein n=1 Tax=Armillaria luteobubalina TaxID=153913 RepID=A0AA39Q088_9AGAR|nr:hypothetical protein EDD18DRAFT_1107753 [Armillaria luteobubalina]